MILNLVLWCLFGLIAGAIAQFLMPGRDPGQSASPGSAAITIALGIVGAALGGWVSSRLFNWDIAAGFSLPSLAVAVGGALVLLLLYRVLTSAGRGGTEWAGPKKTHR